jgi:hypothetical protein
MLDRTHTKFTLLCSDEPNLSDHINRSDVSSKMMLCPLLGCWTIEAGDRHNTSYRRYQCLTSSNPDIGTQTQFKVHFATTNCSLSRYDCLTIFYKFTTFQATKSALSTKQSYMLLTSISSFVRLASRFHNIASSKTSL